jgi:hypothetical protein
MVQTNYISLVVSPSHMQLKIIKLALNFKSLVHYVFRPIWSSSNASKMTFGTVAFLSINTIPNFTIFLCAHTIVLHVLHRKHLLRRRFYCCVRVFRALFRNGSTCHNIYTYIYEYMSGSAIFFAIA